MGKVRFWVLSFLFFAWVSPIFGQTDTFPRQGFRLPSEAADTIWSALTNKKTTTLKAFTVSEDVFKAEVRRRGDTITPDQIVHGQWLAYAYKVDKGFSKTRKVLKKKKVNLKKSLRDTVLTYSNPEMPYNRRMEMYFTRGKKTGVIRFELWRVADLWYLMGKMEYREENGKI